MFLLDTNVLSETVRREPNVSVAAWFHSVPDGAACISALTIGEIRYGVEKLPDGPRRQRLCEWLDVDLPRRFGDRLLPVDAIVADVWGRIRVQVGRPVPVVDGLIASTALAHGLILVTRNVADFPFPGLRIVDPWNGGA